MGVSIKLNQIILFVYLILVSIVLKEVQYIALLLALILVFIDKYLPADFKNLLYVLVALVPFLPLLIIFVIYLPFLVFGLLLDNASFLKRYLLGFAISFFASIILYYASITIHFPLSTPVILLFFYLPVIALLAFWKLRKKSIGERTKAAFSLSNSTYLILLATLFFLIFMGHVMLTEDSLFMSNGTNVYSKFHFISEGIGSYGEISLYDPASGEGEHLFLTDSPFFYSNLAFVFAFLKGFLHPVFFFNVYQLFVLWLSVLGAAIFLKSVLPAEKEDYKATLIVITGSLAIGFSFFFIHWLESFKQFTPLPINFLLFSIVLSCPKKPAEFSILVYLLLLSFFMHGIQAVGIGLMMAFIFILFFLTKKDYLRELLKMVKDYKLLLLFVLLLSVLTVLGYYSTGELYKYYNFLERPNEAIGGFGISINYITDFMAGHNSPLSFKYPDIQRLDEHKYGFFISVFGVLALLYSFLRFRDIHFRNSALFSMAFFLHLLTASILTLFPIFGKTEFAYRTAYPYFLVLLVASICIAIHSFRSNAVKIAAVLVFFGFFFHSSFFVQENLANIHNEQFIAGKSFEKEITFVKTLPIDGRIITYGLFSNAIDAGMSALTGHYFSRYQYNQWDFKDNLYEKVHTQHSFGDNALPKLSDTELINYLRMGGYTYSFVNICHPIGNLYASRVYPAYMAPLYQNECLVFFGLPNVSYAEKVDIVADADESVYNTSEGYRYVAINRRTKYGFDVQKYLPDAVASPREPEPLAFERRSPRHVTIFGDFEDDGWVVFKEEYFPRWKAYMGGQEVPVLATNHNMVLVQTVKGGSIKLEYDIVPLEKTLGLISLAASVAFLGVLVFFLI